MNIKISTNPKNTGSCSGYIEYLQHENGIEGLNQDDKFFNHRSDQVNQYEVVNSLDNNKNKLTKDQDKFFDVIASPSAKEWEAMGKTDKERLQNFKDFIKNDLMQKYAENFNKGLNKEDIMYFAKVHEYRETGKGKDKELVYSPHAHIVVSRKDINDKMKLSPLTNHKGTTKGAVKGGFDRMNFFEQADKALDKKFNYERSFEETLKYQHTMKNGKAEDIVKLQEDRKEHNLEIAAKQQQAKEMEAQRVKEAQQAKEMEAQKAKEAEKAKEMEAQQAKEKRERRGKKI